MSNGISIRSRFKTGKPMFSVEFFPPKDEAGGKRMLQTAKVIEPYNPDFVSITYGAGGGTRETTMRFAPAFAAGSADRDPSWKSLE